MLCYDIDDETLHLVLQLHMEDLEEIRKSSKGKHRQDELPDADFAIEMYRSEIESRALFASDRSMCRSIAQAARRDGELVNTLVQEEQQALEDRQYALWLSRQDDTSEDEDSVPTRAPSFRAPAPEPTAGAQYNPAANDRFLQRLHVMYMDANAEGEEEDDTLAEPESSSWGASRADSSNLLAACNGCFEEFARSKIARCPCDHGYCRGCLSRIFENSITDESLFPPRCCAMHIPVDGSRAFLSPALVGRFRARKLELSTRDKTYCFIPTCSQFIPKQFIKANIATCQRCSQRTCTICKAAEHKNEDCPQDAGTQTVLRVAKENEWQQCRTCHRIVELTTGCNHMGKFLFGSFLISTLQFLNVRYSSLPLRRPVLLHLRSEVEDVQVSTS